jgi:hypothetical protein
MRRFLAALLACALLFPLSVERAIADVQCTGFGCATGGTLTGNPSSVIINGTTYHQFGVNYALFSGGSLAATTTGFNVVGITSLIYGWGGGGGAVTSSTAIETGLARPAAGKIALRNSATDYGRAVWAGFTTTTDAAVSNTVSETTILGTADGSKTIPANWLLVGRTIRITVMGTITNTATPTLQIRAKLGASTILDTTAVATVAITGTRNFRYTALITCRTTGASGTVIGEGELRYNSAAGTGNIVDAVNTATTTIDTTATQVLDVTAQWGAASASNTITGIVAMAEIAN